jgi:hypothetical protein
MQPICQDAADSSRMYKSSIMTIDKCITSIRYHILVIQLCRVVYALYLRCPCRRKKGIQMEDFCCISVLGRGHFGKVLVIHGVSMGVIVNRYLLYMYSD